jgi:putative peptidoglycan lipid II flippase
LSALGDENGKRANMTGALKFIMIGSIPSSLGLIFVGRPLISLLEGGQFDASASDLVYSTLQFFALGLIVHSVLEVIARSFYADGDTLTPLWAALGGAAINLVLSFTLSGVAQAESALSAYGVIAATAPGFLAPRPDFGFVGGLALANSLGVMFEVVFLMFILRKRWHGINESALATTTLKTLAASLVMTAAIVAVDLLWVALDLEARGRMLLIVEIAVQVVVGILVFVGTAALLRMEELRALLNLILRRRTEAAV